MTLDPAQCASDIFDTYSELTAFEAVDFPATFAAAYETYAAQGIISVAVNTGGTESLIESVLRNRPITINDLGDALADYWATVGLTPAPGYTSVSNDAASLKSTFRAAVVASIRDTRSDPPFEEFITNIEGAAKSITWTGILSGGGSNTSGVT